MKIHREFTAQVLHFQGYTAPLPPGVIAGITVVGYGTSVHREARKGCIVRNSVSHLVVHKNVSSGRLSKQRFVLPLSDAPAGMDKAFLAYFQQTPQYALHDMQLLAIAKDILQEFGNGYCMPSTVEYEMNHNPHYEELRTQSRQEREQRLHQARQSILEVQGQWYADDSMSGVFGRAMAKSIVEVAPDQVQTQERIDAKRREIKKIDAYLSTAHKYEATWVEKEDRRKLVRDIAALERQMKAA